VTIGVSIGISFAPQNGQDPDLLLRRADLALYQAKSDGRNCYRYFHDDMETKQQQRGNLEQDLRNALRNHEFDLYYQPIVNLELGSLTGFEALLRWNSPVRGKVSPAEFVPFAEDLGLMHEIGCWVLKTACQEAARWEPPTSVSVNISPTQFRSQSLVQDIQTTLSETGLHADLLELEVTETAMIQDIESAHAVLKQIARLGVRIALDDFGTGYSSLSFLRTLPFTRVKIDRSFIKDIATKHESKAIVRAVAEMCNTMGVSVTAEGVETEQQASILRKETSMEIQGYWISRPRPADEVPGLIAKLMKEQEGW
jgi:predicted signal transduction protein with EAL and GGDEF domain